MLVRSSGMMCRHIWCHMDADLDHDITQLLSEVSRGDPSAAAELYNVMYAELHRTADALFKHEPSDHTLQPTAVINEVWVRLLGQKNVRAQNRKHFLVLAARMMRRLLIDHARGKSRQKRGGQLARVPMPEDVPAALPGEFDVLALNEALEKLACLSSDKARLVELRVFGGLTLDEAAQTMGITREAAAGTWAFARAWLVNQLRPNSD